LGFFSDFFQKPAESAGIESFAGLVIFSVLFFFPGKVVRLPMS
jgi:hypothetical protein